jgi:protein SCO1/2
MKKSVLLLFTALFLFSVDSFGQVPQYAGKQEPEIGIYEHLDEYLPDDVMLLDKDSNLVNLKSLINKPTVFSFVYFNCPGLCSPLLDGVAEVIDRTDLVLGKDYQVITISFNPNDRPALGVAKKANYVKQIKKPIDASQWFWFTGDSLNIEKITNAFGFKFKKQDKEYIHAAAIMVVSPKGKITRYLHGTYFLPFDLKMAVIEAQEEQSSPTINKVLQFCFSYDAKGKKYVFNITKISGSVILAGALMLLLVLVVRKKDEEGNSAN